MLNLLLRSFPVAICLIPFAASFQAVFVGQGELFRGFLGCLLSHGNFLLFRFRLARVLPEGRQAGLFAGQLRSLTRAGTFVFRNWSQVFCLDGVQFYIVCMPASGQGLFRLLQTLLTLGLLLFVLALDALFLKVVLALNDRRLTSQAVVIGLGCGQALAVIGQVVKALSQVWQIIAFIRIVLL